MFHTPYSILFDAVGLGLQVIDELFIFETVDPSEVVGFLLAGAGEARYA